MKKILSLFALLMTIVIGAKADTEYSPEGGTKDAAISGTSFTIDGKFNAGSGTKMDPMTNKGAKIRNNVGDVVIAVNEGFRIDGLSIYAASNDGSKTIIITDVKVDGVQVSSLTVDDVEVTPTSGAYSIQVASKNASAATVIKLPSIAATENIELTIGGTHNQARMQFKVDYTQTEVITQEITGATLYGAALSSDQIATLKSTNALTIDGSSLNGMGVLGVTLNTGATTPTVSIDGNNAVYKFSINGGADEYTVTVTNVKKSYSAAQGTVVYYDANALTNSDKTLTMDGIVFNYSSKTFGKSNNTAGVTLGSTTYKPIKLSTGEAVNVTFPTGKVATKIIVYGWSAGGNGKLVNFTDGGDKSEDTSSDIFYGDDLAINTYPSVYEYTVDNWEAFTFQGNGGQPFVVFDFVLEDATPAGPIDATFSLSKTALKVGETAKVLVNGSDIYGANFNVPTSLWESAVGGPYISLSEDGTVTAIKATPDDYCFYFFANSKDTEKYVSKQTTTMYLDITEDAPASEITTESDKTWDINSMFTSNVAATTINDNMEVITTSSLSVSQSSTNFPDGSTFTRYISLKKSSEGQLHIKVAPNSEIIVYAKGGSGRSVKIVDGNENELMNASVSSSAATPSCFYTGTEDADIYISNGGTSNSLSVFAVKVVPATNIPVTLGTNGYSTYCGDENFVVTSGATAYTATLSGTTVTLNEIAANTVIGKGTGIVLVGTEGETAVLTTSATAASSMELGNNLVGVNAETTDVNADAYVLASNGTKTAFVKAGSYANKTALLNKAYIVYAGMQEGSLDIQFEGEATAINNVNANDNADSAAPVKVIKNGKLFIGNYNVAGQLVK